MFTAEQRKASHQRLDDRFAAQRFTRGPISPQEQASAQSLYDYLLACANGEVLTIAERSRL